MATVGSSLSSACSVFGAPQALSNLNRGGGYVRNYASYSGVSATDSGLALSQLVGLVYPVSAYALGVRSISETGSWISAGRINFNSDGTITNGAGGTIWSSHVLFGSASHFQWYVGVTSSESGFNSGTLNNWVSSTFVEQSTTQFGGDRIATGTYYVRESTDDHQWAGLDWTAEALSDV